MTYGILTDIVVILYHLLVIRYCCQKLVFMSYKT